MVFQHDMESISILVSRPTTQSVLAAALLGTSHRVVAAIGSNLPDAMRALLSRVSAVMLDDHRSALSEDEWAAVLAEFAEPGGNAEE